LVSFNFQNTSHLLQQLSVKRQTARRLTKSTGCQTQKLKQKCTRLEAVADNLENDELVNVPVDPREVECAPEPEKSKWIDGIQNEMPNLDNMDVFDRATQEEYDTWKAHDSKLPRPLPAKLV